MRRFALTMLVGLFLSGAVTAAPLDRIELLAPSDATTTIGQLRPDAPTILHFWATWCGPCRGEMPQVNTFAEELKPLGLEDRLVIISVDTADPGKVRSYLSETLGFTALPGYQHTAPGAMGIFGLPGFPATLYLDASGQVVKRHAGVENWRDATTKGELISFLSGS